MVRLLKALPALLLATFTAATDLQISNPSASNWWVAKSTNVMVWDCTNTSFSSFTVLINNTNPSLLLGPLAFIAIQQNYQCSVTVSQDQVDQPPGPGYTLLFADSLNNTNVYVSSEQFEIKPLGSLYPSQVSSSSSVASGTGTGTGTAASSSPSSKSGALSAYTSSFFGLAGAMGLLAAGLLGA